MTYYRVKQKFDNVQMWKHTTNYEGPDGNIYIGGELYTEKELEKHLKKYRLPASINNMFDKVDISNNRVYWSFGARFYS